MATTEQSSASSSKETIDQRVQKLIRSTGWVPDPPSWKDHTTDEPGIAKLLGPTGVLAKKLRKKLPSKADLRRYCSPVQYQGQYNTCTAHVVTSMLAVQENRAHGAYVPASRLFLYQVTKRMLGSDDASAGVFLRQMMGSLVLLGVPPETHFPYVDTSIDDDDRIKSQPDAFCYAIASEYRAMRYLRLDPLDAKPAATLDRIRAFLVAGFSTSIGFPLFMSALKASMKTGEFPMPNATELQVGSHAVLLVGFDDNRVIKGTDDGVPSTTGAFRLKNSWNTTWGKEGYGWLPYEYLLKGYARDVWTLLQSEWVNTDQFQIDLERRNPG